MLSPLCVMCVGQDRIEAATVVDHIKEHRGNPDLFWDTTNLQSLCESHYNAAKQRSEARGYTVGSILLVVP